MTNAAVRQEVDLMGMGDETMQVLNPEAVTAGPAPGG